MTLLFCCAVWPTNEAFRLSGSSTAFVEGRTALLILSLLVSEVASTCCRFPKIVRMTEVAAGRIAGRKSC